MSEYTPNAQFIFSVTIVVWLSTLSERLGNNEWIGWVLMTLIVVCFLVFIQHLETFASSPLSTELPRETDFALLYGFLFLIIFIALGWISLPPDQFQSSFLPNSAVTLFGWFMLPLLIIPTIDLN